MRYEIKLETNGYHVLEDGKIIATFADQRDATMFVRTKIYVHGDPAAEDLTFGRFSLVNQLRCVSAFHRIEDWSLTDWSCALAGEAGEACNVAKKLRRLQTSDPSCRPDEKDRDALLDKYVDELADTVIYADLCAAAAGRSLGVAVIRKFNEVSDRLKCEVKL